MTKKFLLPLFLVAVVVASTGCGTPKQKPVAWNIKITKPAAIEVDIVAVTTREKTRVENYSVDKYWSPGDLERKNSLKLTSPPQEGTGMIDRKDNKVWKPWLSRSVTGIFVIANLPGTFEAPDPRREFITLDKNHWDATRRTLEIEVQENRIVVITPEVP